MTEDQGMIDEIRSELFRMQDLKYRDFQSKLTPTVDPARFIGVRTPELRKLAKQLSKREDIGVFLNALPHTFFDENQLHAFILSEMRDFPKCMEAVDAFLPYVDNWATCDQMSPGIFRKHKPELLAAIRHWIASEQTYTVRFGIKMLMDHFLDADFRIDYLNMAAEVRSGEYYVRMMLAWFFTTALAKQYAPTLPFIEEHRLDPWTHNKTIRKAIESDRISSEQKAYLRALRKA